MGIIDRGFWDDGGRLFAHGVGGFVFGGFVAVLCFRINPPLRIDLPTYWIDRMTQQLMWLSVTMLIVLLRRRWSCCTGIILEQDTPLTNDEALIGR